MAPTDFERQLQKCYKPRPAGRCDVKIENSDHPQEEPMETRFEYGTSSVKDLSVTTGVDTKGKRFVREVLLDDEPLRPSNRFWNSLHLRFGFTSNIFHYFSHEEVFHRISEVAPNDRVRWCVERDSDGDGTLLAVTSPTAASIEPHDLIDLL